MTEPGVDVMSRFVGPENVDRGRDYLEQQLQLGVYIRAARRQAATEDEIREVIRQVAVYAGFPNAWNALATMKQSVDGFPEFGAEGGSVS
jgi:alkylhydroperoxidase/carboxymuconolactone decarboxylase family protein YurZ